MRRLSKKKMAATDASQLVVRDDAVPLPGADVAKAKAEAEARAQMEADELAEILPLRKPKHLVDGTASGLKLIVGGAIGGAVGLVAMPALQMREGAKAGGAKGAAKGFAAGLAQGAVGAVAMPLAGAVSGTGQIIRGVVQTPYAVSGAMNGKQWDKEARTWRHYSLPQEEEEVKEADAEWTKKLKARREALKAAAGLSGGVEDTSFYELLQVPSDAPAGDIKRAYMKLAMKMHPDKNRDDPQATEKFQKLGEAYQVLSNEDTRARYDAKGMEGLADQNFMDPSTMYAMLFGSEKFDDLIGELQIAALLQQAQEGGEADPSLRHMAHKQRQREVLCARKLADRLQPFVDGELDEAAFAAEAKAQATELAQTSFGELLTHTIGRIYVFKASQALKMSVRETMRMKGHSWATNAKALKAMVRMYKVSRDAQGIEDEAEQAKAMQKDFATFLEGAWYVSVVDVEATLRHVCKKVLTDTTLARDARKRRAQALRALGEVFLQAESPESTSADGKTKTLRERLQEMMPADFDADGSGAPAAEDDDDDDDFADLDQPTARGDAPTPGSRTAAADDVPVPAPSREVLQALSVRELKAVMLAQGLSPDGLLEKSEFVEAILAATELASGSPTRL